MLQPRKSYARLSKYRPPLEGRGGKLRLDFNENTVGCAPQVVRALRRAMTRDGLSCYPEYAEGRVKLARYFGVKPQELVLTNGTDDAVKVICETFVEPGDALLVPAPTFPVYQFFHEVAGGRTERVYYDERFRLPLDHVLRALGKGIRWAAFASPNNPTGTVIPKRDLRTMLESAPQTAFVVDEAYHDFSGETVLPWIRKYPNLIVTRTFSKAFGLAALRLGCILTNAQTADDLRRGQNPFPVNSLALVGALAAIEHTDYARRYAAEVRANRAKLIAWFEAQKIPYVPSKANFVLTELGANAPEIGRRLRAQGILVRDWNYDPRLRGFLRFTVGSTAQTGRLMRELRRLRGLIESRDGRKNWSKFARFSSTGWVS
ncbi:MAG: histidinol-phosphate aminotransferase family protein [Acidobacteriia bacterium]|nr:histidinol-phosphate aminotransferase family protein [Terriglobia bacterium]